jgi:hypothetical protein
MIKVFLGGTCNDSNWRDVLMPMLLNRDIEYFNPVVDDWTDDCQAEEERQKELCTIQLYVITPKMKGVFSIAEVVDSSNKHPLGTILVVLEQDDELKFNKGQMMSLNAVKKMVKNNGASVFDTLEQIANAIS